MDHPVDCDARLRDVRRHDDLPLARELLEDARLVLVGQAGVQGKEGELPGVELREGLDAILDGELTLEEDEDVAFRLCPHDPCHDVADCGKQAFVVSLDLGGE